MAATGKIAPKRLGTVGRRGTNSRTAQDVGRGESRVRSAWRKVSGAIGRERRVRDPRATTRPPQAGADPGHHAAARGSHLQARRARRLADAPVTTHGEHRSTVYIMCHQFTMCSNIGLCVWHKCLSCNRKKKFQTSFVQFNLKKQNVRTFTMSHALAQLTRSVCPFDATDQSDRPGCVSFRRLWHLSRAAWSLSLLRCKASR